MMQDLLGSQVESYSARSLCSGSFRSSGGRGGASGATVPTEAGIQIQSERHLFLAWPHLLAWCCPGSHTSLLPVMALQHTILSGVIVCRTLAFRTGKGPKGLSSYQLWRHSSFYAITWTSARSRGRLCFPRAVKSALAGYKWLLV